MTELAALRTHLDALGRVMLGYSGGVDSALLGVIGAAHLGPQRFLAVIGRSASYPVIQHDSAREIAERFRIPLLEVGTAEMDDPRYAANPVNRCYYCKNELWTVLSREAAERGFDAVIDGTNRDDLAEHRPGLQSAAELGVRSPLAELGWTKTMVRQAAQRIGIPIWNAPSSPCLSSRIQYGITVTHERLRQIEQGEEFLRRLGVAGDLRVRHHGDYARIEASQEGRETVRVNRDQVDSFFRSLGFGRVELDPRGYRRGSLLTVLAPA
jgi:uncharacterized protein